MPKTIRSKIVSAASKAEQASDPALRVLLILIIFVALRRFVEGTSNLPHSSYYAESLFLEFLKNVGIVKSACAAILVIVFARTGRLHVSWDYLQHGIQIRLFVMILAASITWPLVTAGFNYYFDHGFAVEKIILLLLLPFIWWRPGFVYLFIAFAYLLLWQLGEPSLGGSIYPHKLQLLRGLVVYAAAFTAFIITGDRRARGFLIVICSFVAAAYWIPAVAKMGINWLSVNKLWYMPVSAYSHGWLASLTPAEIVTYAGTIAPLNFVAKLFVLGIEALCLIFLLRRRLSISLLVLLIVFHLAVFALYGFFFWTWILVDLALIILLRSLDRDTLDGLFNARSLGVSVLIIAAASWWASPPILGWYDTPLSYSYRVTTTDQDGRSLQIHPKYFAPYDDVFTMSSFSYLDDTHRILTGSYGTTHDDEIIGALTNAKTPEDVLRIEERLGRDQFDLKKHERLETFLTQFIANKRVHNPSTSWLDRLRAPQQFWSSRGVVPASDDMRDITITETTIFFDGKKLHELRSHDLMHLDLPFESGQ